MIDPTPNEQAAITYGGKMAGEYLDSLGKTDLAILTVEEWQTLLTCIVGGYCDRLCELAASDHDRIDTFYEKVPF